MRLKINFSLSLVVYYGKSFNVKTVHKKKTEAIRFDLLLLNSYKKIHKTGTF